MIHAQTRVRALAQWRAGTLNASSTTRAESANGLSLTLGGWLFASPWMFGYGEIGVDAWNSVVVGALIFFTGLSPVASLMGSALPGVILVSGVWTVASPWIFGYTADGPAMWNSILVGIALALVLLRRPAADCCGDSRRK
jgi:SPW repeat